MFYSTCLALSPAQVLAVYAQRWSLEVTFHDAKGRLGLEEPQGTSQRTVERHAPVRAVPTLFEIQTESAKSLYPS